MSQWNNISKQSQNVNQWANSHLNEQYQNEHGNNYQNPPSNQYVSFNEFINQIQNTGSSPVVNINHNSPRYHNITDNGSSNIIGVPSSSTSLPHSSGRYQNSSTVKSNPKKAQKETEFLMNSVVLKSKLTPTATEFIPKCAQSSTEENNVVKPQRPITKNPKNNYNDESNWRNRPSSSSTNVSSNRNNGHKNQESNKQINSNDRVQNYESKNESSKYQKSRGKNKDAAGAKTFYNSSVEPQEFKEPRSGEGRGGRGEGSRTKSWAGTQRVRGSDRNNVDDEQFASSYNQYNNEKYDKSARSTNGSSSQHRDERPEKFSSSRYQNEDAYSQSNDDRSERSGRSYNGSKSYSQYRDNRPGKSRIQESDTYSQSKADRPETTGSGRDRGDRYGSSRYQNEDSYSQSNDERPERSGRSNNGSKGYYRDERPEKSRPQNESNNYRQYRDDRQERSNSGRVQNESSPVKHNSKQTFIEPEVIKELTQRERLTEQLDKGTLECLVCCERVKQTDTVWSCSNCYHVLHLRCIRKWAMSSMQEGKWRCPACQNTSDNVPTEYRCMCGSSKNPEWSRGAWGAHTCGGPCARARPCPHPCTLRCHPGPCPPCQATVVKKCGCGAETRSVVCSSKLPQECGRTCGRLLACEKHRCERSCHEAPCEPCAETCTLVCYCPASAVQTVPCTSGVAPHWSCGGACGRVLTCGRHVCRRTCHAPPCDNCQLLPLYVTTCPCGKTKLEADSRKSCIDPIPVCSNICAKPLSCGPAGDRHFCRQDCHTGPCPECPDKTVLNCRCGHSMQEVPCSELPQMIDNIFCKKKCNKKLSCGRHRCRTLCCADETHRCGVVCGRTLTCQRHKCEQLCHTGHCAPCPVLSFEELSCACGATVTLPPVPCGARTPACSAPCHVPRPCLHEAHHNCHQGPCPPCVVLTKRRCHGDHEERKTIPCSQGEFSCGMPCGKPLACGKHKCIKVCHKGPCDTEVCRQPCTELRPSCGHPCGAVCHVTSGAPCPCPAPCRRAVRATCACARRHHDVPCHEHAQHQARILSALAATKMQDGETVDVSDAARPAMNLKTLECDDECRVEQRTRQMALALQIRNPDVSAKLAPRYSDFIRQWAHKDAALCNHIHDQLTSLVQLAKKSKQKTRSHSFPSMNWQKRQLIHELCEHFGCESVAYDAEPNRNVVATAHKETSWLPAMSITEVLSREAGKRRVPGPVLRPPSAAAAAAAERASTNASTKSSKSGWATLTSTNAWAARSQLKPTPSTEPAAPRIDYFDNPPE